MNIICIN